MDHVETLINALDMVLNPASDNATRRLAENYLDEFKNSDRTWETGLYLAHHVHGFSLQVRLFGLHSLEHAILHFWNTWPVSKQTECRAQFLQFLDTGLASFEAEKSAIKEKSAQIVTMLALRSWPQYWKEFVPVIEGMFRSTQPVPIETAMLILQHLAESVFVYEDDKMDHARRAELKAALLEWAPFYLAALARHISAAFVHFGHGPANRLTTTAINMWTSHVGWISSSCISDTGIVSVVLTLMWKEVCFWGSCMEFLACMCGRSTKSTEPEVFVPFMERMGLFLQRISNIGNNRDEESYGELKQISNVMNGIGITHVCSKNKFADHLLKGYVDCMLLLLTHKSGYIFSTTLGFWILAIRNSVFDGNPWFRPVIVQLVHLVTSRWMEWPTISPFDELDFETEEERFQFGGIVKSKLYELLRLIARWQPVDILKYSLNQLHKFSEIPYDTSTVGMAPFGCTTKSQYYLLLDSNLSFLEAAVSGIPLQKCNSEVLEAIGSVSDQVLGWLLSFDKMDPLCLTRILASVQSVAFLTGPRAPLSQLVETFMSLVSRPIVSSGDSVQDEMFIMLKRKAASVLVNLVNKFPKETASFCPDICHKTRELMAHPSVLLEERSCLVELALATCRNSGSLQDRISCYKHIVQPLIDGWDGLARQDSTFSPASFIKSTGAWDLDQHNHEYNGHARRYRSLVSYLCNTTLLTLRYLVPKDGQVDESAGQMAGDMASRISRVLVGLVGTIHRLWDPSAWSGASMQILMMSHDEKMVFLGLDRLVKKDETILRWKTWVESIRSTCYGIIGTACLLKDVFYQTIPDPQRWISIETMPPRFYKLLISSVVQPLIINCPCVYSNQFLSSWLPEFFNRISLQLDTLWHQISVSTRDQDPYDDLVNEKVWRDTLQAMSLLLYDLFVPASGEPLVQSILGNSQLATPLLDFVLKLYKWKDTLSCTRSIGICQRLTPLFKSRTEYRSFVGTYLPSTLLQALSNGYYHEQYSSLVSLLSLLYSSNRVECEKVFYGFGDILDLQKLCGFSQAFDSEPDAKKRNHLMRDLLKPLMGTETSSLFRHDDDKTRIKSLPLKLLIEKTRRPEDVDVVDSSSLFQ